jgi:N-methylhydantoinase A
LGAVGQLCEQARIAPSQLSRFIHGTTVATNALIERRGGETALVTTAGFRDLLVLRRQTRPSLYELTRAHAAPLIPSERVIEVEERNTNNGPVKELAKRSVAAVVEEVAAMGVDSVAICLLFSFAFPDNEARIAQALRQALPDLNVVASSELIPEFREYERATTTTADAYLTRPVRAYMSRLLERCTEQRLCRPLVMQSSGGVSRLGDGAMHPVHLVLSGPAGGLNGACRLVDQLGIDNVVTLDMGGTSTDVGVIIDGVIRRASEITLAGLPLRLSTLDLVTIGAGGGSIAWLDAGGALRVGPRSAGAEPGPACYQRGGSLPTVTDAHVVLGHLDPSESVSGLRLSSDAARESITQVSGGFASTEAAAAGVVSVANIEMAQAVRTATIDRGFDPQEFHLLAFGGAGPLHAVAVAAELNMAGVVIPMLSGVLSALGLALSDLRFDAARTILAPLESLTSADLSAITQDLLERAPHEPDLVEGYCDVRYRGQAFELSVTYCPGDEPRLIRERFEQAHARVYGFTSGDDEVEVVTVRIGAMRRVASVKHFEDPRTSTRSLPPHSSQRRIWDMDGPIEAAVIDLTSSEATLNATLPGPAVIRLPTATCLIPAGWSADSIQAALVVERS